ncbi:hypothetical protein [Gordonia amicalis]|uniref:Integral membrane protein n=1 Tax=Gordonia amicalis TaxID=89053 RepID=A0ABU4DJR1_9ACTN|nr:hypothetical protein [Gordonia amicalis]MDV6309995.1 hypothetical protein [Gordonia amicalis]
MTTGAHTIARLSGWLDATVVVAVTVAGLGGFAAVSLTEPLSSAIALVLIGVGAAVAALFVVAVGWNNPALLRPATVWLVALAVWVNALVVVSPMLYLGVVVAVCILVATQAVLRHQLRRPVVTS